MLNLLFLHKNIKKNIFCQQKSQNAEKKATEEVCFKTQCQDWCRVFSCLNSAYYLEVCVLGHLQV